MNEEELAFEFAREKCIELIESGYGIHDKGNEYEIGMQILSEFIVYGNLIQG